MEHIILPLLNILITQHPEVDLSSGIVILYEGVEETYIKRQAPPVKNNNSKKWKATKPENPKKQNQMGNLSLEIHPIAYG